MQKRTGITCPLCIFDIRLYARLIDLRGLHPAGHAAIFDKTPAAQCAQTVCYGQNRDRSAIRRGRLDDAVVRVAQDGCAARRNDGGRDQIIPKYFGRRIDAILVELRVAIGRPTALVDVGKFGSDGSAKKIRRQQGKTFRLSSRFGPAYPCRRRTGTASTG